MSQGTEYQYKVAAVSAVDGKKYQGKDSDVSAVKTGAPENGSIYTVGKLNYKVLDSNKVSVAGMAKITGKVSIPNTVAIAGKVFKVTSIESKAFYRNKHLVDLKIGNNVTYVGAYSFYQCPNLETAKFGSRVQVISTCAFTQCPKLGNVTLPERIEKLGAKLFYQCKSMKTLTIRTTKLNYLGTKALAINSKAIIKVPKSKYTSYVKLISKSGKYSAMKIQKF